MCARRECLTAVNCADSHDHGNLANLQVTHAMLDRDRENIVLISGFLCTLGQHAQCAGVLGVVERDNVGSVVRVANCPDEERDATDRRARDQAQRLVDTKRRVADADLMDPRWHASTLVRAATCPSLPSATREQSTRSEGLR
jgi:hypothetical protein